MCNVSFWCIRASTVAMETLGIVVDIHVAVNNTKPLSVVTQTQQWVMFALMSIIFRTALNNTNILKFSCTVPNIVVRF
jgi:hypothetical protein